MYHVPPGVITSTGLPGSLLSVHIPTNEMQTEHHKHLSAVLTAHGLAGVDLLANQELLQLPDVHPGLRHGFWVPALRWTAILWLISWKHRNALVRLHQSTADIYISFLPGGDFFSLNKDVTIADWSIFTWCILGSEGYPTEGFPGLWSEWWRKPDLSRSSGSFLLSGWPL